MHDVDHRYTDGLKSLSSYITRISKIIKRSKGRGDGNRQLLYQLQLKNKENKLEHFQSQLFNVTFYHLFCKFFLYLSHSAMCYFKRLTVSLFFFFILQVKLVTLVHHMGGIIRKDFNSKVTHLVANSTHGDKFRVCKLE